MNTYFVTENDDWGERFTYDADSAEDAARQFIEYNGYHDEFGMTIKVWEAKLNPKTYSIEPPTEVKLTLVKEDKE